MSMLAGPSQTGIFTVSINPSMTTQVISPSTLSTVPSLQILPQPVQQVTQRQMPQIVSSGQVVNLTPATPIRSSPPNGSKTHTCSFCHKNFSSRYNVTRHEKICKANTNLVPQQQQQMIPTNSIDGGSAKAFQCVYCQKTFGTQDTLSRHQKKCKSTSNMQVQSRPQTHVGHSRRVHICRYCAKEFSTKWNVIRHERLFHDPNNDPVIVPQSVANGVTTMPVAAPAGKPESSKYNAIRHEKICTRVLENSANNQEQTNQQQQQAQQHQQQSQQQTQQQQQQTTMPKTIQSAVFQGANIVSSVQSQPPPLILATAQSQQIQQQQQQLTQQQPLQHQIAQVQHQANLQQTNLQNTQQQQPQQLLPQQTMLVIEQHPTTPFHVCKFCNKQFTTRCDPVGHNLMPTVATITGQPMQLPIGSSAAQLTGLVTPVMASIPQVTLVQSQLQQQGGALQGQVIQTQLQQEKVQTQQDNTAQQPNSQTVQASQQQQQIAVQQQQQQHVQLQTPHQTHMVRAQPIRQLPQQQADNTQQQVQQHGDPQSQGDRQHACKYCEKHFATKWYVEQHEKIHTGEADMCKQCGKYFVTRWHLDKHMRVHMSGGPNAKKQKKENSPSTTTTIMASNNTNRVEEMAYPQILVGHSGGTAVAGIRQISTSSGNVTANGGNELTQTSRPTSATYVQSTDRGQYFLPNDQSINQTVSATVPSSQVSVHSEQQSTVDKSQIANSLSVSYTLP
ncbi:uncharacterized protein LOC143471060 isoform X2 [Clavelina lepadiformis]|uniref:uncharacterized protein LOC143471060 isoform X2 n=1 Tax=Clavelina lepadiformis TaxID=159417 RepID=UPI004042D316